MGKKGPSITTTSLPDDYVHLVPRSLTVREWDYKLFQIGIFLKEKNHWRIRRAGNPQKGIS